MLVRPVLGLELRAREDGPSQVSGLFGKPRMGGQSGKREMVMRQRRQGARFSLTCGRGAAAADVTGFPTMASWSPRMCSFSLFVFVLFLLWHA